MGVTGVAGVNDAACDINFTFYNMCVSICHSLSKFTLQNFKTTCITSEHQKTKHGCPSVSIT